MSMLISRRRRQRVEEKKPEPKQTEQKESVEKKVESDAFMPKPKKKPSRKAKSGSKQ